MKANNSPTVVQRNVESNLDELFEIGSAGTPQGPVETSDDDPAARNLPDINSKATEVTTTNQSPVPAGPIDPVDVLKDFLTAKDNIQEVIEIQMEALNELALIARENEKPSSYEMISELSQKTVDANKSILELYEQVAKIELMKQRANGGEDPRDMKDITYVGTAAELQALVNSREEEKDATVDATIQE